MMHYASAGVRTVGRKATNSLGHNGPGGTTTTNSTSKSFHIATHVRAALRTPHVSPPPLVPPRNPSYKLFSASKNFLQIFFGHLTAPGLRAPTYLSQGQHNGARSLHSTAIRRASIQHGLSLSTRNALRNHALRRQVNMFLPNPPGPVPPRFGGVAQVGLGTARNFSSARPIFQQLAQNVPVVARALYEIDWDLEMRKEHERMCFMATKGSKSPPNVPTTMKPIQKIPKRNIVTAVAAVQTSNAESMEDIEHYFPTVEVAPVTTYLLIPLAPTPTNRQPLPSDPVISPPSGLAREPALLPPLSYLGSFHVSHSVHSLRVSTLFARLDQADVWSRGVYCSAYSQGHSYQRRASKFDERNIDSEGVCTVLKVEFQGWTKAEVRAVIGESGTGWCVLEEIVHKEHVSEDEEDYSDSEDDSLSSSLFGDEPQFDETFDVGLGFGRVGSVTLNPVQSLVLPILDFSSGFMSSAPSLSNASPVNAQIIPEGMETDPWVDEFSPTSSRTSSYSDLSDIIDPPSSNGADRSIVQRMGSSPALRRSQNPKERFYGANA